MRAMWALVLSAVMVAGAPFVSGAAPAAGAQSASGGVQGVARDGRQQPLAGYDVQIRNVATGQLAGTGTTNASGGFAFTGLMPGNYVVEVLNAAGDIIGTTAPIAVSAGMTATATVTASATGAMAATSGGFSFLGLGPAGTIAVLGAAGAAGITAGLALRDGKIEICHKPAGAAPQTIEISESARESHLAHGDTIGACPESPAR